MLKKLYLYWFVFVYALYCYLNRGVAYTYFAEVTWFLGLLLVIRYRKEYIFPWDRRAILLVIMLAITALNMARGIIRYSVMEVLRDSFIINYAYFIFIVFLLKDDIDVLKEKLYKVYQWFPLVVTATFVLRSRIPILSEVSLFGNIPLLVYKNGDLAVHLLITTLLMLNGNIKTDRRFQVINVILIAYLFLVTATFNRGGMMAYVIGFSIYLFQLRKTPLGKQLIGYIRYIPLVLIIALPLYLSTKVDDGLGRNIGLGQLKDNVASIVNQDGEGGLKDNVVWRLLWWKKIIDYTFFGEYFFYGKGLGINLATSDEIPMEDDLLRSPHNFHLNLLARFGVPFFLMWICWMFFMFRPFKTKVLQLDSLSYMCIIVAFLVNASFDVALEGPMAAFPFWTFVGFNYIKDAFEPRVVVDHIKDLGNPQAANMLNEPTPHA
ncbi:MAG: hypothetical protein JWQ09_2924 [Segetibacter sp.]|nr:hypothetical protein [Segetibacter sp.]